MKFGPRIGSGVLALASASAAYAQGEPSGHFTWIVFGGGVVVGLGLGLLWCWLRCRALKDKAGERSDRP